MRARYAAVVLALVVVVAVVATVALARGPVAAHRRPVASQSSATSLVDPLSLPRGPESRLPDLVDGVIHTPTGPITLRFPGGDRADVLMGEVDSRFVVGVEEGA